MYTFNKTNCWILALIMKFLDRIGNFNRNYTIPHVNYQQGHVELDAASLREHEEFTKVKNITEIELGRYEIDTCSLVWLCYHGYFSLDHAHVSETQSKHFFL